MPLMGCKGSKDTQVVPCEPDGDTTEPPQDEPGDMGLGRVIGVVMACVLPQIAAIIGLSLMGFGLQLYNTIAEAKTNWIGNAAGIFSLLWLCSLFAFDWQLTESRILRYLLAAVFLLTAISAAVLKAVLYPWASVLFTLGIAPALLLDMRSDLCSSKCVRRKTFYKVVGCVVGSWCFLLLVVALAWTWTTNFTKDGAHWTQKTQDKLMMESEMIYFRITEASCSHSHFESCRICGPMCSPLPSVCETLQVNGSLNYLEDCSPTAATSSDDAASRQQACMKSNTVWFTVWMVPWLAVVFNLIIAGFCFLESRFDLSSGSRVESLLKQFICLVVFLIMGMYCSIYASGASVQLASAFMAFFAASMTGILIYTYFEVDLKVLQEHAQKSKMMGYLYKMYKSDWARALLVGGVNVLIPLMFGLDILRAKVRRVRKAAGTQSDPPMTFTTSGQKLYDELNKWNWCSILVKVNLLGELFWTLILGSKFTYILFSWLNVSLKGTALGKVVALVYFVGCGMFLLPPVPGSAVYLFAGIVIGAQAEKDLGFLPGVLLASIVGFVAKLSACIGQYGIGFLAGKNVKVQKTIGVNKVGVRAIEKILNQRGLKLGKVAILVGGPDWPTSVTCGILKLNIPQMLLGTLPVYFASIAPQTIVGALLTKEGSAWNAIRSASVGIAALGQAGASLIAAYSITQTIERDAALPPEQQELTKPRPEHEAINKLAEEEQGFKNKYAEVCTWSALACWRKAVIILSAVLQLCAGFVLAADFVLLEPLSLRKFAITNEIDEPFDKGGLNKNPINVVRCPVGVMTLSLFALAVCLHVFHSKDMSRAARKQLAQ